MRAFSQDEEILGCRGSWFVAVVSDINSRSDGTRVISLNYRKAQTRLQGSWRPFRGCPEARIGILLNLARLG